MIRLLCLTVTCAIIIVCALALPVSAKTLIQIVVDDTGALQDSADPNKNLTARETLSRFLVSVGEQYGRDTEVVIISQFGVKNVWSGQAREIKRSSRNQGLQEFLKSRWGGCSDLLKLPALLDENIFLRQADDYEIFFFSSMLHTGCPGSSELILTLPEKFLTDLKKILTDLNKNQENASVKLKFIWVYDDSRSKIRSQLIKFIRDNSISAEIKPEAEARSGSF